MSETDVWFIKSVAVACIYLGTWLGVMLGLREARATKARLIIVPQAIGLASLFVGFFVAAPWLAAWLDEWLKTVQG